MLKEKLRKLNKKKLIILLLIIASIIIFVVSNKNMNQFNIKGIANRFVEYQYYDAKTVFVMHTKYLDDKNAVLSPTVVKTQNSDNLSYEIDIPQIDGYTSNVQELKGTLNEAGIEYLESLEYVKINVKDNIYNIYITIKYTPIPGSYTIEYYEQNLSLDAYEKVDEEVVGFENGAYTGEVITGEIVTISPNERAGFYLNTEKTEMTGKVEANDAKVFKAYYDRNSYYFYTYNTGDSYYDPIELVYGENLDTVKEPTYSGFEFDGWKYFKELDGEEIEKPEKMPEYDLYAEAQWKSSATHYTFSYYTENANDDGYINIGTYQAEGTSGENLKDKDLLSTINTGFSSVMGENAKFYHYNETKTKEQNNNFDVVVEGSGITIVAIYYDRNVYNVELDFNDDSYATKAEVEIDGTTYTDSYTFQAKYDQDITGLWLKADDFTQFPINGSTQLYFEGWSPTWNTNSTFSSMRLTLTSTMINDATNGSTQAYIAKYSTSNTTKVMYYMIESFDQETEASTEDRFYYNGKYYDSELNYKQVVYSTSTNWSAKQIAGLTSIGMENDGTNFYFYYDRNTYNITLYNMNDVYVEKEMKYGQSLEELISLELGPEDFTLETPGTKSWVFDGWYQDSNFMIPVEWTNEDGSYKTITDNLVLYAKWSAPNYTITFNTDSGNWSSSDSNYNKIDDNTYTITVEEGGSISRPENPTKKGYVFQGWYYDVEENSFEYIFSDSEKVYSDLTLTAKYHANPNISYRVRYIEAQYENGELIEDISKYTNIKELADSKDVHQNTFGTTVVEYPIDVYDSENENNYYVVNTSSQELVLNSENIEENVIYFIYAKNPELTYTVYHVKYKEDEYGDPIKYDYGEIPEETEILSQDTKTASARSVEENMEEFIGWTGIGDEIQTLSLRLNEEMNTMYFYYNENAIGEYVVNFFFKDEYGLYSDTPTYVYESQDLAGKVIYATEFEEFVWENGATKDDYVGKVLDEDRTKNAYLVVTTTDEVSAMNIYYKNRSDISYIVKYLDENGKSLIDNKIVEGQTYLSYVTETAEKIDGYKIIAGEDEEKTIQLQLSGNEIVFNYEIESNLDYVIRYVDKDTKEEIQEQVIKGGQVYNTTVTEVAPNIDGYTIEETEKTILIGTGLNEIVFEYAKRTDLSYTVEYYYSDTIDNSYTETFDNQTFKSEITEYIEKEKPGYKLDRIETLPMIISTGDNRIKVYYILDPDQIKELSYNVEYYKDGVLFESETHTESVQLLEEDILTVQKDNINTTNKYEGYYFESTEPEILPETIAANETIKVNYTIRKDLSYTIKYLDKETNEEIKPSETKTNQTFKTEITEIAPSIEGYNPVVNEKTIIIEVNKNEIIFEYTKRKDLSYTIKYLDNETNEEIKPSETKTNQTFKAEITEIAPDIKGYKKANLEETIIIGVEENEVIFYYDVITGLPYTVNYYLKGTEEKVAETKVVEDNTYGTKITEIAIDINGYYKEEPSTQEITIGLEENVINFYYTIRADLSYRVEYYFNGTLDEEKTEIFENQTFNTEITEYQDKIEKGYKLNKVETIPMTVGTEENIIKVYYITDPSQTKKLTYTVEYYKDGTLDTTDVVEKTVQWLEADTLNVDKTKINTNDKYEGYYFINTEPEEIADVVETGYTVKVYYEIRKDLNYTIKYLDAETGLELKEQDIKENQTYNSEITEIAPDIDGYVPIEAQKTITIGLETNEIVFEYTNRTDLSYRVEYYYKGVLDESKTEYFEGLTFKTEIKEYTDKIEKGYMLDNVENFPMIVGTEENVIKVYYVADPNQTKKLKYTVEYYKDETLAKAEIKEKTVQWLEEDMLEIDKTEINTVDKFDGYNFVSTEPEEIPHIVETGYIVKVNYTIRKDLAYTVKYIDVATGSELLPEETFENQTYNTKITKTAPEVIGFLPKQETISITIGTGVNEIVFEYEIARNLVYTVNYYEEGTETKVADSKDVGGNTYGDIVEETAIEIDGYNNIDPIVQTLTIQMKDNNINFYYARRTDLKYTVEHYIDGKLQEERTDVYENQTFKTKITKYTDKSDLGYKVGSTENFPLTISTDETANVIKVHYVIDESQRKELKYTVEYYKDETLTDTEKFTKDVQVLEPETMAVDKEKINVVDKYVGYYFSNTEPDEIPDEVTNGDTIKVNYTVRKDLSYKINFIDAETGLELKEPEIVENQTYNAEVVVEPPAVDGYVAIDKAKTIVIDIENNEVSFEYTNRIDLTYTVEYYYNDVLDEANTDIFENQIFKTKITEYESKDKRGYKFDRVENLPLTINVDESQNVIKVYYVTDPDQTKDLSYTVEYYKDGVLAKTEKEKITVQYLEPDEMTVNKEKINTVDKYDGYYFDSTEPQEIPDVVTSGDVIKVNYTIRKDLTYTIKYIDIETGNELLQEETFENQTYNTKITKTAPEIIGFLPKKETISITIGTEVNEIVFEYEIARNLVYTVNYYEEGTETKVADSKEVGGNTYGDIVEEVAIEIDGYNKIDPTEQALTIKMKDNNINFYYAKRTDLKYTVEHYIDGKLQEEKTDVYENQTFKTKITKYTDKSDLGYKVGSTENLPLTISTDETANVIKVHYVIDESQRKELKYTVEYYKDETLTDTEKFTKDVQVLEPETMAVDKEKINVVDKYVGYYFSNTEPDEIPDEVTNGDTIKVNYTVRKDLSYKINFIDAVTGLELKEPEIVENQTYNTEVVVEPPVVDGYTSLDKAQTIVIDIENNEVSFEYTNRTDLTYTVEHYYNDVLDEANTDIFKDQIFRTKITEYEQKVKKGYKFDRVENLPLTIDVDESQNVIKVYYVTDPNQTKKLNYTVEYYKDEVLAKSEIKEKTVQWLEEDILEVDKSQINIVDKFDGYYFDSTEPQEIPDIITSGDVIKVNYIIRKDLVYTVKYIDIETGNVLLPEEVFENQTFNTKITLDAPVVIGYIPLEEEKTITIGTGVNEIVFEYEIAKNLSYTVNYYEEGTETKAANSKVVDGKTYGDIVEETAIEIDGYNNVEPLSKELTIGMEDNNINFYYAKRTDLKYTVEHYIDGKLQEEKTDVYENQTFKTEITKYADKSDLGYKVGSTENLPLTISTDETANVIKVHYVIDESQRKELKYTVEYYKDETLADTEKFTKDVQVLEPETMTVDKEKINVVDKYVGYYFSNTEPDEIPDEVINGDTIKVNYTVRKDLSYKINFIDAVTGLELKEPEIVENQTYNTEVVVEPPVVDGYVAINKAQTIVIDIENNEITFEYTNRTDLTYTVEHYYNDVLDEGKTEKFEGITFKTEIKEYTKKVEKGYKFDRVENVPMIIGTEENVIKVYYVTDPSQTKELSYEVEYYKDGVLANTEKEKITVQYLEPEEITVNKEKINTVDKFEGYYFDSTEPEEIPDVVTNGDVIKVIYTIRKDLSYKVSCIDALTGTELKEPEIVENQTYNSEVIVTAPTIDGYTALENEQTIVIDIENNEVVFEYTTRNDLTYTVEYYYNNELNAEKTEKVENQIYKAKITKYTDKVEVGYKLDRVENLPLEISINEAENIIKVYYVTDESQRKELKYTVEYYKNGILEETEEETDDVQVLMPDTMVVNKEKINTENKFEGYNFLNTEPEVVPSEVTNGDVIKVYYMPRTDLSYTIKYLDIETENELKEQEIKENQVYDSEIKEIAPEIPGYTPVEEEKTIKIGLGTNEIIFGYTKNVDIEYKVEYYYNNVLAPEETETLIGKYQEKIDNYEDKCIVGYKLEKTENFPLTLGEQDENVIRVYYQIDDTQQKDLSYTVKYYIAEEEITEDKQLINKFVQAAQPDELEVDKTQINVVDKYYGYKVAEIKLNDEVVEELPDKVLNGDIIQIIYVIDENATKELGYTVEYYKDGIKAEIEENKHSVQVLEPDTLTIDKTKINVTDKYIGYKFEKINPETIPDVVNNGDTIKVYYVKDNFEYRIEYYYDGIKDDEKTIVKMAKYQDTIDSYDDKIISGYILEKVENVPLSISELKENNVIKVYYAKETFGYTINYYYEGVKDDESTVTGRGDFGEVISEYPDKIKSGYELDRTENIPLTIAEDANKNVINVYYKLKDSQIEIRFVDKYTKEEIIDKELVDGKVFEEYDLTQNRKEIPGYTLISGPQNVNVKFEEEKVIYIFTYAKNTEVIVKYLEKDETIENEDNTVLATEEKITGYEGIEYETTRKEVENYTFVEVIGDEKGLFGRNNVEVIYLYAQNTKVVVNHIDKATEETMETVEYTGKVGDSYQAEAKNFENYVLSEKPENENGIMTKDIITVNYYYNHISSGVIEKHIDLMSNEILENILHEGVEGIDYSTQEKVFEGYEVATNARYYSKYVLDNPEVLEENDVASVEELLEKLKLEKDAKYIPENAEGKMSIDATEVNYYYLRKAKVKVEYVDKATNEVIKVNDKDAIEIIEGCEGDEYKTAPKEFEGYELEKDLDGNPKLPENKEGKMQVTTDEDGDLTTETIVRYYYEKLAKVVEKHIDIVTGNVIEENVHNGAIGKEYKIENKELDGFEIVTNRRYYEKLVKDNPDILKENGVTTVDELLDKLQINSKDNYIPENAEGNMTKADIEVKYYYIRKIKVIVQYLDKDTGKTIQTRYMENGLIQEKDPTVTFEGYEGDSYKAKVKDFEYYVLAESEYPTNETGIMAPVTKEDGTIENTMYVTYYYVRKTANIKVEYVDAITGEVIRVSDNYTNNQGEAYNIEPKEIEGYDVIIERIPANASGTLYEEGEIVRYYYIKKTKVIVKYLDKETNNSIEQDTVINGHEGDSYKTEEKVIKGYSLNTISGETTGKMTREDIIVTYYYDKKEEPKAPQTPAEPSDTNQTQGSNTGGTQNKQEQTQISTENTDKPIVTITPSGETLDKNGDVIKTGDVGPRIYMDIILFTILINIIQIAFTDKKTKVAK